MSGVIDLMRHGQPVGGRRYRGQQDDPLSEAGWQQMRSAVEGQHSWQAIISSPLSRCSAFANELADSLAVPVQLEARFAEIGFGVWEGKTPDELLQEDAEQMRRFFADPIAHRPEGAEQVTDFLGRVGAALEDVVSTFSGQHVLVVAHAGVIRASVAHALGLPAQNMFRIKVDQASITRLTTSTERAFLLEFQNGRF